jgi:hypothetical protein
MKVILDREKLRRRAAAAHAASLGGMLTMLGSVAITVFAQQLLILTTILLFLGFATATTGIYFANRWVRKPRPEDILDQALKGLDDRHCLYHYLARSPAHLLLTPSGLVVLETRSGDGYFEFEDGRWRQKITLGKALRFFVEEPLGDPFPRPVTPPNGSRLPWLPGSAAGLRSRFPPWSYSPTRLLFSR